MKKYIFLLTVGSWLVTTFFWFSNVDLSFFKGYINFEDPIAKFNLIEVVRGHVLIQFMTYVIFGVRPWAYYLVSILFHALSIVIVYKIFNKAFKNSYYSFLLSILVGVNIAYSNAIFEGAFNQYYPVLLLFFLTSIYFLLIKKHLYLFLLFFGFFIRETILVLPVILFFYYILFNFKRFTKKELFKLAKFVFPIFILTFAYLIVRKYVLGDLKSDLTDDAVQTRVALMQSGRYVTLFILVLINFFRMFAEQLFTYPFLNLIRENLIVFFKIPIVPTNVESSLFISALGFLAFIVYSFAVYIYLKNTNNIFQKKYLLFGFTWVLLFNLFISFVLPFPLYIWENNYTFFSVITRYNYYSIFGLFLSLGILFEKQKYNKNFQLFVSLILIYNFILIQIGGFTLINKKHKSAFEFYNHIFSTYKSFPDDSTIYFNFFRVNNLRDYVGDLVYIFGPIKYKTTKFQRESTLSNIQNEIKMKNLLIENIFAFDFIEESGEIIDLTNETRQILKDLNEEILISDKNNPNVFYSNKKLPYTAKYLLAFDAKYVGINNTKCDSKFDNYLVERFRFLNDVKIKSASKYGDDQRFYFINDQKLIDNRINSDSNWQGGLINEKDEIIFDLKEEKEINGIGWISNGQNANPTKYKYYISQDGENWELLLEVNDNNVSSKIDRFKSIKARYVKIEIIATKLGQPALYYEIEILNYPENIKHYNNFYELLVDSTQSCMFAVNFSNAIINYSSDKSNFEFPIFLSKTNYYKSYQIEVYALEAYIQSKNLVKEDILSILFNTFNYDYDIKNVKLIPWHKVN